MTDNTDDRYAYLARSRNGAGRFVRDIATVRRDAAATDYLAEHPGTTHAQLARLFGYYDGSTARQGILRARDDVARPAVTKLIAAESEELDALYVEACAILQRNHITVSHGKIVMWRNPDTGEEEPLLDDGPKLQAIQVALRVRQAYQDLHGLKQPARIDATIHEVTQQDLELQEMLREAKARTAAEEQQIRDGGDS